MCIRDRYSCGHGRGSLLEILVVIEKNLRPLSFTPGKRRDRACLRQRRPPRGEVAVHTDRRCDRGPPLWRSTVTDQGNTPSGLKNQVSSYGSDTIKGLQTGQARRPVAGYFKDRLPHEVRRNARRQDRVFPWPIRGVPSAIHSATSSTALAPSALAESPPVASSNWRTTSAASRPRSLTFRPCARAQFRTASLCASEPLLLAPPPEPARLGARRRLAVALFAPPVRPRVPCPGPRAARCGRSL